MVPFCCLHLRFRNRRTQTNLPGGLHRVFDVTGGIWSISWTLNCDQGGDKELHQTVMMSLERRAIKLVKLYAVNKELAPKKKKKKELVFMHTNKMDRRNFLKQSSLINSLIHKVCTHFHTPFHLHVFPKKYKQYYQMTLYQIGKHFSLFSWTFCFG